MCAYMCIYICTTVSMKYICICMHLGLLWVIIHESRTQMLYRYMSESLFFNCIDKNKWYNFIF